MIWCIAFLAPQFVMIIRSHGAFLVAVTLVGLPREGGGERLAMLAVPELEDEASGSERRAAFVGRERGPEFLPFARLRRHRGWFGRLASVGWRHQPGHRLVGCNCPSPISDD